MLMNTMILYLNENDVLSFGKCSKKLYKLTMSAMKNKHILKVMLNGPKNKNDEHIYKFQYDDKAIATIMTFFMGESISIHLLEHIHQYQEVFYIIWKIIKT